MPDALTIISLKKEEMTSVLDMPLLQYVSYSS